MVKFQVGRFVFSWDTCFVFFGLELVLYLVQKAPLGRVHVLVTLKQFRCDLATRQGRQTDLNFLPERVCMEVGIEGHSRQRFQCCNGPGICRFSEKPIPAVIAIAQFIGSLVAVDLQGNTLTLVCFQALAFCQ